VIWHHIFSPFPYFLFVFIRRGTGENLYFNLYRNKYITKFKNGLKTTAGVAGSIALFAISKGKINFRDK